MQILIVLTSHDKLGDTGTYCLPPRPKKEGSSLKTTVN